VDDVPKAVLDDFDYQARTAGLDLLELTANRLYPGASRFVETVQHDFRIASHNFQVVVVLVILLAGSLLFRLNLRLLSFEMFLQVAFLTPCLPIKTIGV
jgi:hypothetical protein